MTDPWYDGWVHGFGMGMAITIGIVALVAGIGEFTKRRKP